jgi:Tat binding protein 1(TBP-1)-interacting protein (TBPIP)
VQTAVNYIGKKAGVKNTAMKRCLEELAAEGKLVVKMWKKTAIYFADQVSCGGRLLLHSPWRVMPLEFLVWWFP